MEPTIHGQELSPGDHLGVDTAPVCCDTDMTGKDTRRGSCNYTCGDCGTVVSVASTGLVDDIR